MTDFLPLSVYVTKAIEDGAPSEAHRFTGLRIVTPVYLLLGLLRWRLGVVGRVFGNSGSGINLQAARIALGEQYESGSMNKANMPPLLVEQMLTQARRRAWSAGVPCVCTGGVLLTLLAANSPGLDTFLWALKLKPSALKKAVLAVGLGWEGLPQPVLMVRERVA